VNRVRDARLLATALALVSAVMIAELVAGVLAGSLALLADGGHMLADAGALAAAVLAARLALAPARGRWTYGFQRAEILSAAGNGVALIAAAVLVIVEAVRRLVHPVHVTGPAVIGVAAGGLVVNAIAAALLHRADRSNLNVEGSLRHVHTDLWAFLATIVAGAVIVATGQPRADAAASLLVSLLMLDAARRLLTRSGRILLEAAPESVDLDEVRAHLLQAHHVLDVHDLHVWTVTSDLLALSAHVVVEEGCFSDGHAPAILDELQACLGGHFDVEHSTFQLEPAGHTDHEAGAHA
jgi:cobalt-zinc-cadmium efflux system protein